MRKPNIVNVAAFAAGVYWAIPSYANDIWQFTVTNDQNGPNSTCNEALSIPCSITNRKSPYILGTLTMIGPLAGYEGNATIPNEVYDDDHVISFVASVAPSISWPAPIANYPLVAYISVNETTYGLSGSITIYLAEHGSDSIVMMGMNNLWTGYWTIYGGPTHQFWAKSDKVLG